MFAPYLRVRKTTELEIAPALEAASVMQNDQCHPDAASHARGQQLSST